MTKRLKTLFLVLAAVAAALTVIPSAALSAVFTPASDTTTVTRSQVGAWTINITGEEIVCYEYWFKGEFTGTSVASITVTPEYTECESELGLEAKVTGFGHYASEAGNPTCDYVLKASGTTDIVCQPSGSVTIEVGTCTVHFSAQTGVGPVTFSNGVNDINMTTNINNLRGTHTDGFLCPFSGGGEISSITVTGSSTILGEKADGSSTAISHDP